MMKRKIVFVIERSARLGVNEPTQLSTENFLSADVHHFLGVQKKWKCYRIRALYNVHDYICTSFFCLRFLQSIGVLGVYCHRWMPCMLRGVGELACGHADWAIECDLCKRKTTKMPWSCFFIIKRIKRVMAVVWNEALNEAPNNNTLQRQKSVHQLNYHTRNQKKLCISQITHHWRLVYLMNGRLDADDRRAIAFGGLCIFVCYFFSTATDRIESFGLVIIGKFVEKPIFVLL